MYSYVHKTFKLQNQFICTISVLLKKYYLQPQLMFTRLASKVYGSDDEIN